MILITRDLSRHMSHGSSIFSTGGGLPFELQQKLFSKLFLKYKKLPLISLDELKDTDYICTAYAVGSGGNTHADLSKALKIGMDSLRSYTRKTYKAIFAGETNIDVLAFQTASQLNLPVLDADATGGRAVPEIQFDNFAIAGKSTLPLIAVTPNYDVVIISQTQQLSRVDSIIRGLLTHSKKGLIAIVDHSVSVKDAKDVLTRDIFKRAIQLGRFIDQNKHKKNIALLIVDAIDGKLLINGKITDITLVNEAGFLTGYYSVTDNNNNTLKVFVKNENLLCWKNNKLIVIPPDYIITLDLKTLRGAHNSELKKNQEVVVAWKKATPFWNKKQARKLFHPKFFGFTV